MGLFNRKKQKVLLEREKIFNNDNTINKNNWFEVFSACLGKMMAIQTTCADIVVKNQDWNDNKIVAHFNQDLLIEFEQADDFLRICNIETL